MFTIKCDECCEIQELKDVLIWDDSLDKKYISIKSCADEYYIQIQCKKCGNIIVIEGE